MCRNSNLNIQIKEVTKILFKNWFFCLFWTLKRETGFFIGKFLAGLSKLLSTYPEEHRRPGKPFMGKNFSKEKKSLFFPFLSEFLLLAKNFGRFAKSAIYVSCIGGSFSGKTFFEKFFYFFKYFTLLWSLIH